MTGGFQIVPPFFEIGPKCYLYGDQLLSLARAAQDAARQYNVSVIFDPPHTALQQIAEQCPELFVFAQHMDTSTEDGRGMGAVTAKSIVAAGAVGCFLNHAERPVTLAALYQSILEAKALHLRTIVCADSYAEASAVAHFGPEIIVAEPTRLIGGSETADDGYTAQSINAVKSVDPSIFVLQGAGIRSGEDVYRVIRAGADGTGSSSGIVKARDPESMVFEMIAAVRAAWNDAEHNGISASINPLL